MAEVPEIIELQKIVEPFLQGATLESYKSQYLTKPGDNYGSIMLSINAKIKQTNGDIQDLPLIAKLPPLTNDLYWQIFQPERTCITENAVYKYLSPELKKLQLEAGVLPTDIFDGFPRYYGSRISLDADASKVDRDAVLVQENVTSRGYRPGNRHKSYDLEHTVLILHYLAQFHALPLALRLKKPKVYDQFVRPYFKKFNMNDNMEADLKNVLNEETLADIKEIFKDNDRDIQRVQELQFLFDEFQSADNVPDGLWTSIGHMDAWINNLMVKYGELALNYFRIAYNILNLFSDDDDEVPTKLKIVDFQIAQYESVVHDIIFLLLSSVDTPVLEENYYNFLRIYYDAFIKSLRSVHADTSEYSYEAYVPNKMFSSIMYVVHKPYLICRFLNEVKRVAHIQIPHALFMTKVVLAENDTLPDDYKDVDLTVLTKNRGVGKIMDKISDILRLSKKFGIFY
ncbi:hypothetical protein KR093_009597 [Drosophila rubida]|uniref:CHK kinase-like domain-containing protein n=1 Tax=Drosophila rubida TaxID=30044 RepID=A0AAD4JVR2_9MUSC|nr:hypothetical protein KR093_009597 [Drosophila rubida]